MFTLKQSNLILGYISLTILASSCIQVDAQFFTKSSKSIPRMGRRSDNSIAANQYKHQLIDSLIDEYGPQYVAALEGKSIGLDQTVERSGAGEVVYQNDQPFDHLTRLSFPSQSRPDTTGYELLGGHGTRDERSPSQHSSYKDSSLAMRALNLNRLMQYLSSGGQPLVSYEKLFAGRYRTAGNGATSGERDGGSDSMGSQQKLQPED